MRPSNPRRVARSPITAARSPLKRAAGKTALAIIPRHATSADPIFKRIERHRLIVAKISKNDSGEIDLSEAQLSRATISFDVASWDLLDNPPVTHEGALALLHYSIEVEDTFGPRGPRWPNGPMSARPGKAWTDELRRIVTKILPAPPPAADPIFAAIENHNVAIAAFSAAVEASSRLLASHRTETAMDDAALVILSTTPTTLQGVAAVLQHMVDHLDRFDGEPMGWPDALLPDGVDPKTASWTARRSTEYFLMKNVAATLRQYCQQST
jgi:hypothetical protein